MDVYVKKTGFSEPGMAKEEVTISEKNNGQNQPPVEENSSPIKSVAGNAGQFSGKGTSCPEVDLSSRFASVSGGTAELTSIEAVTAYTKSREVQEYIELALNIIKNPTSKTFECSNHRLSQIEAKAKLKQALKNLENAIIPNNPKNYCNLKPIENVVKQAYKIVANKLAKEKLHKAKEVAKDALKMGSAILAIGTAAVSIAATAGASIPIAVPAILGASTTIAASIATIAGAIAKITQEEKTPATHTAITEILDADETLTLPRVLAAASSFAEALTEASKVVETPARDSAVTEIFDSDESLALSKAFAAVSSFAEALAEMEALGRK